MSSSEEPVSRVQHEVEEEREQAAATGLREEVRDHSLTRLDEKEAKVRMREAQDQFIEIGFAVYLIGVKRRRGVDYTLELHRDGARNVPIREIQAVADSLGLDLTYSGEVIMVDARPRPNW